MFTVGLKEFVSLFKSVRSIIIILFIFGVTLGAAKLISQYQLQMQSFGIGDNAYVGGLFIILFIAGPMFVTSLSHNVINREVSSKTIRFLATKTSRDNIVLGKFLGNILFWTVCILLSLLLIVPFAKTFYFAEFFQSVIFISYFLGLTTLLSVVINKPMLTMFLGITIAFVFPILGFWYLASDNIFLQIFGYITPFFYYFQEQTFYTYFVVLFPIVFVLLSLIIMRKKDF